MIQQKYIDKFHTRYKIDPDTGCWNWQAGKFSDGYGAIPIDRISIKAHRFSAMISGFDMSNPVIRHKCDNRACVNPAHLETGWPKDNTNDMMIRERYNRNTLTANQVLVIRAEYDISPSPGAVRILAEKYSVTHETIRRIIKRLTWKHI